VADVIQSLIFSRALFDCAEAIAWAIENGYRASDPITGTDTLTIPQRSVDLFDKTGFAAVELREGVTAQIGSINQRSAGPRSKREAGESAKRLEASTIPNTWNPEARTIEVVLSNERTNSVEYSAWGERWIETLSLEPGNIRLDRINGGAPFLIGHRGYDEQAQIGKFIEGSVRVEGSGDNRQLVGTVAFSRHLDEAREAHVREIADGTRRNVSVGFRDFAWFHIPGDGGAQSDRYVFYDWEPMEGSSVSMGADDGAKFRSMEGISASSVDPGSNLEARAMPNQKPDDTLSADDIEKRATELANQKVSDELNRRDAINACAKVLGVDDTTIKAWVADKSCTADEARKRAFDLAAARSDKPEGSPIRSAVRLEAGERDAKDVDALRLVGGMLLRDGRSNAEIQHCLSSRKPGSEFAAVGFRSDEIASFDFQRECQRERRLSIVRIAERCLRDAGEDTSYYSDSTIIDRALAAGVRGRSSGLNTTSAFPLLLAEVLNVSLRIGFEEMPIDLSWARMQNARDFRANYVVTMGEAEDLEELGEGEEYATSTMQEGRESWSVTKYGRIFGITHEAMVNDYLGGLTDIPRKWGAAGNRKVREIVFGVLTNNAVLSDSVTLFNTSRGNTDDSGAIISVPKIDEMRVRMATREGFESGTVVPHMLKHIILAEGRRTLADQILGRFLQIQPQTILSTANQFVPQSFGGLNIVADPLLDAYNAGGGAGQAWFGTDGESVVYSWLDGEEGIQLFTRDSWHTDGMSYKCRLTFGAGAPYGWRGLDRNIGATS